MWIYIKLIYFYDAQLYFQHHYSLLQCHMIFRNNFNLFLIPLKRPVLIIIVNI